MWLMWQLCVGLLLRCWTTEGRHRVVPPGYQKDLRPSTADGSPLRVGFSYVIDGIHAVNEEEMSITFQMFMRVMWQDMRLVYEAENTTSTSDLESDVADVHSPQPIHISSDALQQELWRPDPFYRRMRSVTRYSLLEPVGGALLYPNLSVYASMPVQLELSCSMAFSKYPFDEQSCELYIGSYFYTLDDLEFYWLNLGVSLADEVEKELAGYDFTLTKNDSMKCYCHKCVPKWSPCTRTTLRLSRRYVVHLMGYYVPSALFIVVSWCSFFWPPDVIPGRTVLVVTCLLTVVSLYADIRQTAPETSYVKAVDSWMFMTMLLTSSALFQYAFLLQLQKKLHSTNAAQLPPKKIWNVNPFNGPLSITSVERDPSITEKLASCQQVERSEFDPSKPIYVPSASMPRYDSGPKISATEFDTVKPGCESGHKTPATEFDALKLESRVIPKYERQMTIWEAVARWGLPLVFIIFNLSYWPYYLL
ncbi:Neurotransmitter-gated ion-channel transmembrane domain [Trinorchestia longiramus]|nr:Neurotransmitter-gated ion-channel transmembrane domain [Trinorchestia longiramus]